MKDIDQMTEAELRKELRNCRNELCIVCGIYRKPNYHNEPCGWCKWKIGDQDEPEQL